MTKANYLPRTTSQFVSFIWDDVYSKQKRFTLILNRINLFFSAVVFCKVVCNYRLDPRYLVPNLHIIPKNPKKEKKIFKLFSLYFMRGTLAKRLFIVCAECICFHYVRCWFKSIKHTPPWYKDKKNTIWNWMMAKSYNWKPWAPIEVFLL